MLCTYVWITEKKVRKRTLRKRRRKFVEKKWIRSRRVCMLECFSHLKMKCGYWKSRLIYVIWLYDVLIQSHWDIPIQFQWIMYIFFDISALLCSTVDIMYGHKRNRNTQYFVDHLFQDVKRLFVWQLNMFRFDFVVYVTRFLMNISHYSMWIVKKWLGQELMYPRRIGNPIVEMPSINKIEIRSILNWMKKTSCNRILILGYWQNLVCSL